MPKESYIIRYSSPTRYDKAPFNTLWIEEHDNQSLDKLFVQTQDNDQEIPIWIELGELLCGAYSSDIHNENKRAMWIVDYLKNNSDNIGS